MKVREGAVRVKAVYLAIGINMNGEKEVLGLWLAQTEGPSSGCRSSPNCATGACRTSSSPPALMGSRAFLMPSRRVFPKAVVQLHRAHGAPQPELCLVEARKDVAADLRRIYQSTTAEEAELRLGEFEPSGTLGLPAHWPVLAQELEPTDIVL